MVMADCRLAAAVEFEIDLVGATLTVTAHGVILEPGEVARVILVSEGPVSVCRLEACVAGVNGASTATAVMPLAAAPHTLVIEHLGGKESVALRPPDQSKPAEGPLRGSDTWWQTAEDAEESSRTQGP